MAGPEAPVVDVAEESGVLLAETGAGMPVTDTMNIAISAMAVNVAKMISAGDPRQNP
jgi:hypothetical protein